MGSKKYMFKLSTWEGANRIPLIIQVSKLTDSTLQVNHPVSLIDLYPTLIDFAGLPGNPNKKGYGFKLDGHSLRPFIEHPKKKRWPKWRGPAGALSVVYGSHKPVDHLKKYDVGKINRQHFTVRFENYRYTSTNVGAEELYDQVKDPNEFNNLANYPQYVKKKQTLEDNYFVF